MSAPSRAVTLALKLASFPLLIAQGRRVRATALRLPEAAGERSGIAGTGPVALRLLVVGDSSAAGVGVETQQQALVGQLTDALADCLGAAVGWQLVANSGHTAQEAAHALAQAPVAPADVLLTVVGVNDVVDQTRPAAWLHAVDEIHALAVRRAGITRAWHCGLPPMGRFPLLPHPLRAILGRDAAHLDDALGRHVAGHATRFHLPLIEMPLTHHLGEATDKGWMAQDGFHPGLVGYREWGRQVARAMTAGSGSEGI